MRLEPTTDKCPECGEPLRRVVYDLIGLNPGEGGKTTTTVDFCPNHGALAPSTLVIGGSIGSPITSR